MTNLEITKKDRDGIQVLEIAGRLDAHWADHLGNVLDQEIMNGNYHLCLDLKDTNYISSAGIRLLVRVVKKMKEINGLFYILEASEIVASTLGMVGMLHLIAKPDKTIVDNRKTKKQEILSDTAWNILTSFPGGKKMESRFWGDPAAFTGGKLYDQDFHFLPFSGKSYGIGLGAIGNQKEEVLERAGEFLALGPALMFKPADGRSKPDYFIGYTNQSPGMSVLYGMAFEGEPSHRVDFESSDKNEGTSFSELLLTWMDICGSDSLGLVLFAESAGVSAASLVKLYDFREGGKDVFSFPGIRDSFKVSTEPDYVHQLMVVTGLAMKNVPAGWEAFVRPIGIGNALKGHFHAAVLPFSPIIRGEENLESMIQRTFSETQIEDVIHLLYDDRENDAVRESSFFKGSCWFGPIRTDRKEEVL
ncbi:MAG: STAS domain-containing protein [Bacteroidetes bacterium]|nr:STAS domain-containing protein [Bacteroidota bacterium]